MAPRGRSLSPKLHCARKSFHWYLGPVQVAASERTQESSMQRLATQRKLDSHLADIDQQAEDLFCQFVEQMAAQGGITEQLKVDD